MTKSQFIEAVAAEAGLDRQQSAAALDAAVIVIQRALAAGDAVTVTGFGRFHAARRGARRGVNPRTGEPMLVPAVRVPRFTAGSSLKQAVRS